MFTLSIVSNSLKTPIISSIISIGIFFLLVLLVIAVVSFLVSAASHNSSKYRSGNKSNHVTQAKFTPAGVDKLNFTHHKDCSDYYHQTCFDKLDILIIVVVLII